MQRVTRLPLLLEAVVKQRAELIREVAERLKDLSTENTEEDIGKEKIDEDEEDRETEIGNGVEKSDSEEDERQLLLAKMELLEASWKRASRTLSSLKALTGRCNEAAKELERMEAMVNLDNELKFSNNPKVNRVPVVKENRHVVRMGAVKR